ncbi:unnamed protein product [Eruca vesicaria subsp. sativa]|uniref:Mediator complex subunit 15 KIX domain-containing protein n=1 Tax=Eruca vesicaria subsp. sativa TaxID=29727 RepID=A0ABC8JCK7_ERUVS|nr:unnamed protein product [Eruca vesicaria subsp. sativa]
METPQAAPQAAPLAELKKVLLYLCSRERIVNKITEQLQKHLPYSTPEEIRRIAVKFEEKLFSSVVNQTGYLRSISMKMLTVETKYQTTVVSSSFSLPFPGAYNSLPLNLGCHKMRIEGPFKAEPAVNKSDWRTCLPPDSRKNNANKNKELTQRFEVVFCM